MNLKNTDISGCFEITPNIFKDKRGYFYESFNEQKFQQVTGHSVNFVQDNCSFSKKGVLRGLHFQEGEFSQAKLVTVMQGEVIDVVVDLRKESPTFKKVYKAKLSDKNRKQLFVPRGCAHGFIVISASASFFYKCDNFYNKSSEAGIIYNDPTLNIDWEFPENELVISEKDLELPTLEKYFLKTGL
ncbi:dTDP-4-dehydrorhamnose 3,5-epimerase [Zunongwangia sp.]|uniref:dTDP-4-dehydrorhamnose 3,5-epimerase n=1 Tax=Zunongwangia sp. TaxID=1965325 RepID=UPI003AA96A5D